MVAAVSDTPVFSTIIEFKNTKLDARKLSRDELILLKSKIEDEMRSIRESIRTAIRNKTHFGQKIDLQWKWKANRTCDIYAGYIQILMLEIGLRKNEKRKNFPFSHFFMVACEQHLDKAKFEELKQIAREMQAEESGE